MELPNHWPILSYNTLKYRLHDDFARSSSLLRSGRDTLEQLSNNSKHPDYGFAFNFYVLFIKRDML